MGTQVQTGTEPLSRVEFKLFQDLIHREAGIFLAETKKALLVGRLSRRLRELGLTSFGEYHRYITKEDPAERVRMLDCVSTNETQFFREPRQFDFIREQVIPEWRSAADAGARPRRIRVWSAACSTGEEPYSLAMTLLGQLPGEDGWQVEIVASDLSTRVLDVARRAVWPVESANEIPEAYLKRYMLRGTGTQAGKMKAGPEIRSAIRFERINLNAQSYPVTGRFDLILCRNVLIYFDIPSKTRICRQLLRHLEPNGYFFLGHAEALMDMAGEVERAGPTIYRPAP
jgi:chemotaxis protein methyltransferase CheR